MTKIGFYQDEGKYVDIIQLGNSKKNQPRDNTGRYIHGNAVTKHFDTYPEKGHKDYGGIKTISLKDIPKTVSLPQEYSDYSSYLIGVQRGTPAFFQVNRFRGSIEILGTASNSEILIGTPT